MTAPYYSPGNYYNWSKSNIVMFNREVDIIIDNYNLSNLQCDFEIEKTLKLEPNTCKLNIYNLHRYSTSNYESDRLKNSIIKINAGYNGYKGQIFCGTIRLETNRYESPNWINEIEAGDGENATITSGINQTFGPNTPLRTVLRALIFQINLELGANKLSNKEAENIINNATFSSGGFTLASGVTISDNAVKELAIFAESCDLEISFQDNKLQVLNKRGVINGDVFPVRKETGLIGKYPYADKNGIIHFDHLINHQIKCGMKIDIKAENIERNYRGVTGELKEGSESFYGTSGLYRVEKIKYKGSTRNINDWIMSIEASLIRERKWIHHSYDDYEHKDPDFPNG